MSEKRESLREIISEGERLCTLLSQGDESQEEIESALTTIEQKLVQKVDAISFVIDKLDSQEKLLKQKADEFYNAAKSVANNRERIRGMVKSTLELANQDSIYGRDYYFKIISGKSALKIENEKVIPQKYKKQIISEEIDKELLRKDLESGASIDGASLQETKFLKSYVNKNIKEKK